MATNNNQRDSNKAPVPNKEQGNFNKPEKGIAYDGINESTPTVSRQQTGTNLLQSQPNSSWDDDDWSARHSLLYDCRLSHRYHKKRERFLSFVDNVATAISLISGASVVSKLLGSNYSEHFGFAVVIFTSLQLVFSLKEKSKQHSILAADFKKLEASIEKAGIITSGDIAKFKTEYLLVETSDPPTLGLLVQICQNEMAIAENQPEQVNKICWFRKLFAQFFDWPKEFESKNQSKDKKAGL